MWQELAPDAGRPGDRSLTIEAVHTTALRGNPKGSGGHYVWGLVVVEADDGTVGIGETFRGRAAIDVVERLAPTVVGDSPMSPPRIAERLARTHYPASGGVGRSAIAAIETACWDLKGRALGVPVYELLGGRYRDRIPLYADAESLVGESAGIDHTVAYEPEAYAAAAREAVDLGFETIKFDLDVPTPGRPHEDRAARRLDRRGIEHKAALVAAVRDEVGDGVDLGMDCHWSYTVETATRLGRALEPYDLAFLEDPVHPERLEAGARVREALPMPVLTGENLTSAEGFAAALDAGALDVAAPDVSSCGGLWELVRIAHLCAVHDVPLAPHNLGSPVATAAGAHVAASIPNATAMEFRGGDAPWWAHVARRTGPGAGEPLLEDGAFVVPEGPGLGVELTADARDLVVDGYEVVF